MFAIITIIESILIVSHLLREQWRVETGAVWCGRGGGKGDAAMSPSLSVSMDVTGPPRKCTPKIPSRYLIFLERIKRVQPI